MQFKSAQPHKYNHSSDCEAQTGRVLDFQCSGTRYIQLFFFNFGLYSHFCVNLIAGLSNRHLNYNRDYAYANYFRSRLKTATHAC
jgi:hypothetical protein